MRSLFCGCLILVGCQGRIETPGDPIVPVVPGPIDPVAKACEQRALPVQPLRRLSDQQYLNTLDGLFGPALAPGLRGGSVYPATVIARGFVNDAEANTVNTLQSNAIEDEGERIATAILAAPDPFLRGLMPGCTLSATITDAQVDACVDAFITRFGTAAYRRPIAASEVAIARAVYDAIRPAQGSVKAWASVVQFFVQSPGLLYRVERGAGPSAAFAGHQKLTDHEMASRLSYLFLNSAPDAALVAAANAGQLSTAAEVAAQARRLMAGPQLLGVLAAFHRDWLHLYEAAGKDAALFPRFTPAVQASLAREPEELLRYVLEQGDGSLKQLLGSPSLPVDPTLAAYYGLTPGTGTGWSPADIPNRRGLLTRGSVMAALAKPNETSPIHRGNFFRNSVLCENELVLPANVDTSTPLKDTSMAATARERLSPLSVRNDCAGCHRLINPPGLALENFNAAGEYRATENGATIDASGSFSLGDYAGPAQFVELIAASEQTQRCYALHWYRAALGRYEVKEDACSVATLGDLVVKSKGDLKELMVSLTQTDAFLYRRPVEATP